MIASGRRTLDLTAGGPGLPIIPSDPAEDAAAAQLTRILDGNTPGFASQLAACAAALAACTALTACAAAPAPSAEVRSVTPEQVTPADDALDDVTIALGDDDGDGDLGGGIAEVHDCRADDVITQLPIPTIAPGGTEQHITGTLELRVNDIGELAPGALPSPCAELGVARLAASTTVLCVILVDAAGHRGRGDCTRPIALVQP